jgi:ubiquinone/menaquinone biosynthesis C-methylase UbiE
MRLNLAERLMTNSPVRAFGQRHLEGPLLKAMASRESYPLCLEIGCGRGVGAEVIIRRFGAGRVVATDIDPAQMERARRSVSPGLRDRIEFKVEDSMALDEPDDTFDATFSFGVVHHAEDWRKAVGEISRVLKAGGEFFFEELLKPFLSNFFIERLTAHPTGGQFTEEEFKAGLAAAGMEVAKTRRFANTLLFGVARKLPREPQKQSGASP